MSKKSKDKIRMMRYFIIQQIKETDWVSITDGVKNNLFSIQTDHNRVNIIYFNK